MARLVIAVVLGGLIGAGAGAYIGIGAGADREAVVLEPATVTAPADVAADLEAILPDDLDTGSRRRMVETVGRASFAELDSLLAEAARQPPSPQRSFALAAIVARLAERDTSFALERLADRFIDPRTARELGLVVLDYAEPAMASIDAVIAALPQVDSDRLQVEAATRFARTSPTAALDVALGFTDDDVRASALREVAAVWLERNSSAALAHIGSIDDPLARREFEVALLTRLAARDVSGATAYIEAQYGASTETDQLLIDILRELSRVAPAAGLELADGSSSRFIREQWGRGSAAWLARTDPEAAMRYAERPPPARFDRTRTTIASVLGEVAPDEALEWVRSLDPMREDLAAAVLEGVARTDPLRAIDLGEALGIVGRLNGIDTMQRSAGLVAERVLAIQDPVQRQGWLESLIGGWSSVDEAAALDWIIAHSANISSRMVSRIAEERGHREPTAALLDAQRMPAELEAAWVESVVRGSMRDDAYTAIAWIGQFRGQPVYDQAAAAIVDTGVWREPAPVAELFMTLSPASQVAVAKQFVQPWARADRAAARAWAAALPPGPARDQALLGLIDSYGFESPDPALLSELGSDAAREDAIVLIAPRIARADPAQAARLIDEHVSDPAKREQLGALISGARN